MEAREERYVLPDTASFLEQLAEIRQYREERERQRQQRPAQPMLADVMAAIQQLMAEVVRLRSQVG